MPKLLSDRERALAGMALSVAAEHLMIAALLLGDAELEVISVRLDLAATEVGNGKT